ncbi:hypothetical protein C8D88_1103 [Lentzea atacamensis]|uniref:DUF3040 domain-containing protein n=2 Tax=Lentzea TaxID=165301 RepID=A0A316HUD7_9PSEU|nr:DUF3040 domain-containing protein [Lentzea atacamensis]PWK83547.1 hypothetical protein C8D88_1103 [Lentzea atacamensis]
MNWQEHRTLRAIEKNLTIEDPRLAELLGSPRGSRVQWLARWLALPFALLGFVPDEVTSLLTVALLAAGTVRTWWQSRTGEQL